MLRVPEEKLVMVVDSDSPRVGMRIGFREGFSRMRVAQAMSALWDVSLRWVLQVEIDLPGYRSLGSAVEAEILETSSGFHH